MTRTRIHNLSISLDGFATGEGQSADAPIGHAGRRLHEWLVATQRPDGAWHADNTDIPGMVRVLRDAGIAERLETRGVDSSVMT